MNANELSGILRRIDGRGYRAYKSIRGSYAFPRMRLHIDHVQGDPFAVPSRMRLRITQSDAELPPFLYQTRPRRIGLQDFLARELRSAIRTKSSGSGKSGQITIDAGGQEVIERTAVIVTPDWVEARIEVGLPAAGRTILGGEAERLLTQELPRLAQRALEWKGLDGDRAKLFVETVENHSHLQEVLSTSGLIAFVADGSLLPRASGASDQPMARAAAIPFRSPESLSTELPLLHPRPDDPERDSITGMGIPEGVSLLVGGGYHGKSTLLEAIQRGVYPHLPGDGREYVVTRRDAVKIRAEDGRRVEGVDISPFIRNLPLNRATDRFRTEDASGSTSQAANIIEAIEAGARLLLLDEDTSATNFMVRDARMQALVASEGEPILPFVDRVSEIHRRHAVSTLLVMGGSGDYFDVADLVLRMDSFLPSDVTEEAKRIAAEHPTGRAREAAESMELAPGRRPSARSFDASRGRREAKIEARGAGELHFGREAIDLRAVEQLVDVSQTRAIGYAMYFAAKHLMRDDDLSRVLDALEKLFDEKGLDALSLYGSPGEHPGNFARPRRYEIGAAINRLRTLRIDEY